MFELLSLRSRAAGGPSQRTSTLPPGAAQVDSLSRAAGAAAVPVGGGGEVKQRRPRAASAHFI